MKENRSHIYFAIAIVVALIAFGVVQYAMSEANREFTDISLSLQSTPVSTQSVRNFVLSTGHVELQFDFGDGTKRRFAGKVTSGMTILDAIFDAANAGRIPVILQSNASLASIGGFKDDGLKHWIIYKNKKKISGNVHTMPVSDKDEIVLKYE